MNENHHALQPLGSIPNVDSLKFLQAKSQSMEPWRERACGKPANALMCGEFGKRFNRERPKRDDDN